MASILDEMTSLTDAEKKLISNHYPHQIIQELEFKHPKYIEFEDEKTPTDSLCKCGGTISKLHSTLKITLPQPFHRKKRIRKKKLKVWEKKVSKLRLRGMMISPIRISSAPFICDSCKLSGYQLAIRNIVTVQPLDSPEQPTNP